MIDELDDLTDFADLGTALLVAAGRGEGTILGLVPAGRAGVRRVSRALADEFERKFVAAYRERMPMLVRYASRKVGDQGRAEDVVHRRSSTSCAGSARTCRRSRTWQRTCSRRCATRSTASCAR